MAYSDRAGACTAFNNANNRPLPPVRCLTGAVRRACREEQRPLLQHVAWPVLAAATSHPQQPQQQHQTCPGMRQDRRHLAAAVAVAAAASGQQQRQRWRLRACRAPTTAAAAASWAACATRW